MDWDLDQIPKSVRREPIKGLMPMRRDDFRMACVAAVAMAVCAVGLAALFWLSLMVSQARGREVFPGQYAQVDPRLRQWFRDQKVPGTQSSCCSESDGVYAEEDIRDGHYWTRFVARQYNDGAPVTEIQSEWMQVPDEAVIHDPNRHGAPVVWWGWNGGLTIRCYAPGGGV